MLVRRSRLLGWAAFILEELDRRLAGTVLNLANDMFWLSLLEAATEGEKGWLACVLCTRASLVGDS